MLVICYLLGHSRNSAVECCGMFTDMQHFERFKRVEKFYGRIVHEVVSIKQVA